MVPVPNATLYYSVALPVDATLGVIDFLLSVTILALYFTHKGWTKSTSFVFMNIAFVDLINSVNTVFQCYLMNHPDNKKVFYSAFFLQAMVLNTSLYLVLLLGILRLVALTRPFEYASLVKHQTVVGLCALIWVGSGVDCYLRYDWRAYRKYKVYLTGVILRIIMIVITNTISATTIGILQHAKKDYEEEKKEEKVERTGGRAKLRQSASFTAAMLSFTYLVCHSYYLYVLLVWAVPGLCKRSRTANPWLYFTGCGAESLSMGHISLLLQSIVTNIIILNQHTLRGQLRQASYVISSIIFTSQSSDVHRPSSGAGSSGAGARYAPNHKSMVMTNPVCKA